MKIHKAVPALLKIVEALHKRYPKKKFTLDGRLVGDLGETLVEKDYEIELFDRPEKHYDGQTPDKKQVQIKTTMQDCLTFPCDHTPDYYLGIKIFPDGTYKEVFNGPGNIARKAIQNRKPTKNNLHSIKLPTLRKLNDKVSQSDRIARR